MAESDLLRNLAAAAMQLACVALLAEVLLRAIPVAAAGFRYAYWRMVLVVAVVLPWVMRQAPELVVADPVGFAAVPAAGSVPAADMAAVVAQGGPDWGSLLPWLLAAGTGVRVLWVAAGLARLRAMRRRGEPVNDAAYDDIQDRLGTRAEIRAVPGLGQPVTFGVWRPVVLLPDSLADTVVPIRRAAVAHELVHVRRRDWIFVLVEELLRAALWFHPAIWWMTARVRQTREEFTDHLAVLATGSRRSYIEALLAFADADDAAPAPAFISRAHLFHRIVLLTKESAMSSRRIVMSGIALALLLGAGGWYASEAFPVRAGVAPTEPPSAPPAVRPEQGPASAAVTPRAVTPDNPIPRRIFATPILYPLELAGTGFESALSVRVVLNAAGAVESAVAGARAVAAPGRTPAFPESEAMERFAAAAVEAISRWQYEPPAAAPFEFYLAVVFKPGAAAVVSESNRSRGVYAGPAGARMSTPAEQTELDAQLAARAEPSRAPASPDGRSAGPFAPAGGAGNSMPGPASAASGATSGSRGGGAGASEAQRPARGFADGIVVLPGAVPSAGSRPRGAAVPGPAAGQQPTATPSAPRRSLESTITVAPDGPIRIGGGVGAPTQVRKVQPVYPEEARAAKVQGVVILEALINAQGRVDEVRVLRSIPLLNQGAVDAVRQWEYVPTMLNGRPVPVIMTVTVQFTLS